MPAEALCIRNAGERQLFGIVEMPLDFAIEQTQLLKQRRMTANRQRRDQVFDHGPQPPDDLQTTGPAGADFAEGEMDEIIPVGGPDDNSQLSGFAPPFVGMQIALADRA